MKKILNVLILIFLFCSFTSCVDNSEKESSNIDKNQESQSSNEFNVKYEYELDPLFATVAVSYNIETNIENNQNFINEITTSKLGFNSKNTKLSDEILLFFNDAKEFNFIATEEFPTLDKDRKNVFMIKGKFSGGKKNVDATLYYNIKGENFKGEIIFNNPTDTDTEKEEIVIMLKGKK